MLRGGIGSIRGIADESAGSGGRDAHIDGVLIGAGCRSEYGQCHAKLVGGAGDAGCSPAFLEGDGFQGAIFTDIDRSAGIDSSGCGAGIAAIKGVANGGISGVGQGNTYFNRCGIGATGRGEHHGRPAYLTCYVIGLAANSTGSPAALVGTGGDGNAAIERYRDGRGIKRRAVGGLCAIQSIAEVSTVCKRGENHLLGTLIVATGRGEDHIIYRSGHVVGAYGYLAGIPLFLESDGFDGHHTVFRNGDGAYVFR